MKEKIEKALEYVLTGICLLPFIAIALMVNSHPYDPSGAGDWEDYEEPEQEPTCNRCGKSISECECDFSEI